MRGLVPHPSAVKEWNRNKSSCRNFRAVETALSWKMADEKLRRSKMLVAQAASPTKLRRNET
jgi:hypothetical protein